MKDPEIKQCSECKFYVNTFCKRYPPERTPTRTTNPHVKPDDWCGEFKQRLQPK